MRYINFSALFSPTQGNDAEAWSPDAVIVDVRSPAEFAGGHVDGALNIPLDQFAHQCANALPDKTQPIVVYCQSGGRSGQAAQFLKQQQYTQVINGINASSVSRKTQRGVV